MLQFIALIQYTVSSDTATVFAQFIDIVTLDQTTHQVVHIGLHVRQITFDLLRQAAFLVRLGIGQHLFRIDDCHLIIAAGIQLLIGFHSHFGIGRLHDQSQLIVAHKAFHSILPGLISHLDQVSQHLHRHSLTHANGQFLFQTLLGLQQIGRIGLTSIFQFFDLMAQILDLLLHLFQICNIVFLLFLQISPHTIDGFFDLLQTSLVGTIRLHLLDHRHQRPGNTRHHMRGHIALQTLSHLIKSTTAHIAVLQSLIDITQTALHRVVPTVVDPAHQLLMLLFHGHALLLQLPQLCGQALYLRLQRGGILDGLMDLLL